MRLDFQQLEVAECISLADAKEHCRIDDDAGDDYVTDLITRARAHCENWCGTALLPQSWIAYYDMSDCFIDKPLLRLPHLKIMSITEVNSYDSENAETTYSSSNYFLSGDRLILNSNSSFPTDVRDYDSMAIEFISGYGTVEVDEEEEETIVESVPSPVKQAMLKLMLHWHENRGAIYDPMNT
jgi:uncharacterized phiE125 gp8 family phage protein